MKNMMNGLGRRTWALVALALIFATVGAGFALGYLSPGENVTAEGLSASADSRKQGLLDGLENGRILYWKMDEFQKDRPSNLPDRFITEAWLTQDKEGRLGSTVGISRDLEGNAVIYGYYANGQATTVLLGSEEEDIVQAISPDVMVEDWLDGVWGRVQHGFGRDGESESRKVVDGKETVVFEWQHVRDEDRPERGQVKKRIEMVINDPLLVRDLTYEVDESGAETLVVGFAVTEYRLLPAGSTMPAAP